MALKKTSDKPLAFHPTEPRAYARDVVGLLAQLADPDPAVRRWAARDLGQHGEAAAALSRQLADEPDASVREAIFTGLRRIASPAAVQGLLVQLRSEDAGLRNGALEVLADLPDAVAPCIDALLHDADPDLRIFAVNLLTDLRHPSVPQWLERVLAEESQVNVVGAALDVLAEVGTPATRPALQAAMRRFADEPYIVFAAELALGRLDA